MSNTSEEESKYLVTGMAVVASTPKKRRNPPGNPDPDAEVIALSPRTLLATNRYICEVCHKGFQRDQNLQLHRRGHNLPWKLKQRSGNEAKKRVYVCPEASCAHHDPTRALGDLTGIKKHYSRKHGDKKWKCDKCAKRYAVQSDWKAHSKICGTKEYRCDCGTIFARKDSFVTHRAFCDALKEENYRSNHGLPPMAANMYSQPQSMFSRTMPSCGSSIMEPGSDFKSLLHNPSMLMNPGSVFNNGSFGISNAQPSGGYSFMPSTAILQQATEMGNNAQSCLLRGSKGAGDGSGFGETSSVLFPVGGESRAFCVQRRDGGGEIGGRSGRMTKDFLGLGGSGSVSASSSGNVNYVENEFYGCQQMSHGTTTPFEKNVWQ